MRRASLLALLLLAAPAAADHAIDPASVLRHGKGYRYHQAGWIVLHIEGEPYERGVQHGRLLAPELAAHVRCYAATLGPKAPAEAWKLARTLTNALFLRGYDREYLEEMKGIADGAAAAGARFDGRRLDLLDVATINAWPEIETLDGALRATPTGIEAAETKLALSIPRPAPKPKPMHCSAFAATGPATKDGKIVFGHITMFSLYPSNFYNVWLDVKPAKGHRVVMQSFPGGIHSGMDYYINDSGLMIAETTIAQTQFDVKGTPLASRIRKAVQYADSIDKAVAILKKDNNGLYTNEWLLGDAKTDEIAMFELGTRKSKLWRSSKGEWYGGTKGFYWGCNNAKDVEVRLETIASRSDSRPGGAVFVPSARDRKWVQLYDKHKGKIDAGFGKLAFTTPPLASFSSVDAKFTTSAMAKKLESWALFGPPLGRTWHPRDDERKRYPEVRSLVSNPWTVLTGKAPGTPKGRPIDLHDPAGRALPSFGDEPADLDTTKAWRGTLLPKSDADLWLALAFAPYERHVSLANALKRRADDATRGGKGNGRDAERLGASLLTYRSLYELGARGEGDTALSTITKDIRKDGWHRVALGKGVLLLDALRGELGAAKFDAAMASFGKAHGGKSVTTAEFFAHVEKQGGRKLGDFQKRWLQEKGLPGADASGPFGVTTFYHEVEGSLIVVGTADEVAANREAAKVLQEALRRRGANVTVAIKTDAEVSDAELKSHHLLLVGRPATNSVTARSAKALPVRFGAASVSVGDETYAHAETAVLAAGESPFRKRYSCVVVAGVQATGTETAARAYADRGFLGGEVVVFEQGRRARALVVKRNP